MDKSILEKDVKDLTDDEKSQLIDFAIEFSKWFCKQPLIKLFPPFDEPKDPDPVEVKIIVCDKCLCASCWQGEFYCDAAKTAGTREMTRAELEKLNLENSSYWAIDRQGIR